MPQGSLVATRHRKRGGVRVIYFNRLANGVIYLLVMYAKDVKDLIPAKTLNAIRETVNGSDITETRTRTGLSQQQFAEVLGVSTRTLQEWEQGRRKPSGAARSLLAIASRRPEVLREIVAK